MRQIFAERPECKMKRLPVTFARTIDTVEKSCDSRNKGKVLISTQAEKFKITGSHDWVETVFVQVDDFTLMAAFAKTSLDRCTYGTAEAAFVWVIEND